MASSALPVLRCSLLSLGLLATALSSGCARTQLSETVPGDMLGDSESSPKGPLMGAAAGPAGGVASDAGDAGDPAAPPGAGPQSVGPIGDAGGADVPSGPAIVRVPALLAPEVGKKLEALQEADFVEPVETLVEAHCGQVFRVDERTAVEGPRGGRVHATVVRAFDAEGRLRIIEEKVASDLPPWPLLAGAHGTRLQIDYDADGRVTRVREGALGEVGFPLGTVIELTHVPDGTVRAEVTTTRVATFLTGANPFSPLGFCEHMELDTEMRLTRTSWGCGQPVEARSFRYDARGRLAGATGQTGFVHGSLGTFAESPAWTIRWDYESDRRVVVTWNETDLRSGEHIDVEQRLVQSLDEQGRITATELDYGNDGRSDERIEYTYPAQAGLPWSRLAYDSGMDGLLEVVEERRNENGRRAIQYRHMGQWGDERGFHAVVALRGPFHGGRRLDFPQSVNMWILELDDNGQITSAELSSRAVIRFGSRVKEVRSSQQQIFHAAGFVERVIVSEETLDPAVEVARREATCSITPICDGDETLPLPTDPALTACQTQTGLLGHSPLVPHVLPPYVPPPFDSLPGMRTRNQHALRFDPTPPTMREIVGY